MRMKGRAIDVSIVEIHPTTLNTDQGEAQAIEGLVEWESLVREVCRHPTAELAGVRG